MLSWPTSLLNYCFYCCTDSYPFEPTGGSILMVVLFISNI